MNSTPFFVSAVADTPDAPTRMRIKRGRDDALRMQSLPRTMAAFTPPLVGFFSHDERLLIQVVSRTGASACVRFATRSDTAPTLYETAVRLLKESPVVETEIRVETAGEKLTEFINVGGEFYGSWTVCLLA